MLRKIVGKIILFLVNLLLWIRSLSWKREKDIVLFGAWFGDKFADNSRFLFQYLHDNKVDLGLKHVIWITRNRILCDILISMGYEAFMIDSFESVEYHKRAGMHIICNSASCVNGMGTDIRTELSYGAIRINLWHGVGVVKGVGCASRKYIKCKENHRMIYYAKELLMKSQTYRLFVAEKGGWGKFYFLSPTNASSNQFKKFSYIPQNKFIKTAYPRTCACPRLMDDEKSVISFINNYKKVILYLPTYRTGDSKFDFNKLVEHLKNVINDEKILWIQKAHSASRIVIERNRKDNILDLSHNFDINVIIPHISMIITDYSSVASDARFFYKPILFYLPDFEEYMNNENGITEEAEELLSGPKFYNIDSLREGVKYYINNLEDAKPENFNGLRMKYWGGSKNLEQIWKDILQVTKYDI